jgi:hypothetical protein
MPLSEQEQRLLDEMERGLYQNDADFVAAVGRQRGKPSVRRIVLGSLIIVAGVAALLTGVIIRQPLVGVLGFAIMFAGVMLVVTGPRLSAASNPSKPRAPRKRAGSFMDSLGDRWDRRADERER